MNPENQARHTGMAAALAAFLLWGFLPIYFHLIGPRVSVWEMLIHRIIWAALLLALFTLAAGRVARVRAVFTRPRLLLALTGSAILIAGNWAVFIWAVTSNHVLESSLGYYINPLLNVLLGFFFLGERLRPLQSLAVSIAAAGVLMMVLAFGTVPWISLVLAGCFGGYGLIRKQTHVDSATGLLIETLLLSPFALIGLAWMYHQGQAAFLQSSPRTDLLLVGAGAVTVVPLVFFAAGARRLRLSTLGLFQYITPTAHFLTGVFLFGEAFTRADAVTFTCIWLGLIIYTGDNWRSQRRLTALARAARARA